MAAARSKISSFSARIHRAGIMFVVAVPAAISRALGGGAHVPVFIAVHGGTRWRTTLLPQGGGRHLLPLHAKVRREAGVGEGDRVTIEIGLDREPRVAELPGDLVMALRDEGALAAFESFPPGRRRQYIVWLDAAVHEATREKRIVRLVEIALAAHEKSLDRA